MPALLTQPTYKSLGFGIAVWLFISTAKVVGVSLKPNVSVVILTYNEDINTGLLKFIKPVRRYSCN